MAFRPFALVQDAAEAERARLGLFAGRLARRAAFAALAGVFALAGFVCVELIVYFLIADAGGVLPVYTALIMLGGNLLLALLLLLVARSGAEGPAEREARIARNQAIADLRSSLAVAAVVGSVGRAVGVRANTRKVAHTLGAKFFSRRR